MMAQRLHREQKDLARAGATAPAIKHSALSFFPRCGGIAVLCWLGFVMPASGLDPQHGLTQYVHRIWQTEPGLPQTTIFTVRQTRDGYLWLGTESGIVRFDGVRFARAPGLDQAAFDDIRARSFAEDSLGRLWIMSSN